MKKKIISILLTIVMLIGIIPSGAIGVFAEDAPAETGKYIARSWNSGKVISSEEDIPSNAQEIKTDTNELAGGWYVVSESITNENRIVVRGTADNPTNIVLADGITLKATAGIDLAEGYVLNIYGQANDTGKIDAHGIMQGINRASAIGGGECSNGGTITVYGGVVTASSVQGAGIGGGYSDEESDCSGGSGGNVTVYGGTVTATSTNGAGIGGGFGDPMKGKGGDGGNVTVYGGTVTATSKFGAGIGGGEGDSVGGKGGDGGNVTVYGGTVTATSEFGAGIGGGEGDSLKGKGGDGGNVTVYGGTVTATSTYGAGIGGSPKGNGGSVTVYDGTVEATSSRSAGIGGGERGNGGSFTIAGGIVTATSTYGAGIGGGEGDPINGKGGDGGTVTATSKTGAGIGGGGDGGNVPEYVGKGGDGGNVTVYGGTVTATSTSGAGIGGGEKGNGGSFTIAGGTVTATSTSGAGIGAGNLGTEHGDFITHVTYNVFTISAGNNETEAVEVSAGQYRTERSSYVRITVSHAHIDADKDGWCDICDMVFFGKYVVRSWDEDNKKVVSTEKDIPVTPIEIKENTTELDGGWYFVPENVEINERITVKGTAENPTNIILRDGVTLFASAGIAVNENNVLNIYGQANDTGKIDAHGIMQGINRASAIGGGELGNGGTITIYGGVVTATSTKGAGIGGGFGNSNKGKGGDGGNVTVYGGTVTATSTNGAGIGGGNGIDGGSGGNVTVYGGTVTATSEFGAGIGGGDGDFLKGKGGDGGNVTVYGGTVTATSRTGAGIGGGYGDPISSKGGDGGNVTVYGGTVTATSTYGAGIGGGLVGNGGSFTITGGIVTATSEFGAGIGGSLGGDGGSFTITGGTVIATSSDGTPIGAGKEGTDDGVMFFKGGTVTTGIHEHTYSDTWSLDPYYHWHDATCEHNTVDSFGAHTFGNGVADGNKTVYTCSECGYQKFVYNPSEDTEGEVIGGTTYTGISLTLGSDIAINFYMELSEEARQNGKMTFNIGGRIVTLKGTDAKYNSTEKKYYFSTPLTALEMNETVIATFNYNGIDYIQEYSVREYIETIVGNSEKYGDYAVALAKKIANYGHYAQTYLASIHTNVSIVEPGEDSDKGYDRMIDSWASNINVADAKTALANYKVSVSGTSDNLSLYGSTVYFDSATALNYYVTVKDGVEPTATAVNTVTGEEKQVEIKLYKDNIYIISVKNITATELADDIEVKINNEITLTGSVFAYCNAVMTKNGQTDAAKNAMAAFYEYYVAACDYAESVKITHTVTFDNGTYCPRIYQTVKHGDKAYKPTDPMTANYAFDGWYADDTFETPWDFNTPITQDTTIYGKWIPV